MKRLRFPFPSIPAGITRSFSANTTHSNNNSGTDFYSVDISSLTETDAGTTLTHKGYFSSLLTLPHQLPDEIFFFTADPHSGGVAAEESSNRPSSYLPPHHNSNSNQYGKKHARPSVYCRLCGESVERSEVKSHITGIFNYLPYSHAVRHVLLECLTLLALRGFPIGKGIGGGSK
ncbi:hypothetical protein ADEAN_000267600 [Angomonas deanei]|uniref:Uncharacterized protein n=1 Tax=Angomonas deanei TaxID=59799 RepID=A0A7G2C861_9TRYP|nr:hypothetical protein ADEAN_000267600 [Angomonas deanei]